MAKAKKSKAEQEAARGDAHLAKNNPAKALDAYRKAAKLDPSLPGIYDRLIQARDLLPGDFAMEDFADAVTWVMKKQEQELPHLRQTHAQFTPEWREATALALEILQAEEEASRALIERLVAMGEVATRAVVGLLVEFKKASAGAPGEGNPTPSR